MLRIFYGTPGAGKSYGALRDMIEELAYGERLIVTNLSLDLGKLNEWMHKEFPWWEDDINCRIRLITEEQTGEFYSFRTVGMPPLHVPDRSSSLAGVHVKYFDESVLATRNTGVCYIIDEAHIKFDSREWKEAGPELTYYASQHRKLNDECIFITQHPDMLNNRLRMLCQEFWSFNNFGLEKVFTYFSKPAFFTCEVHRKLPTGAIVPPPMAVHRYRLDKSLADCYDTSAGIGITGRKLPEKKERKGFSIFWLAIPIAVGCYLLFKAPEWVAKGAVKLTTGTVNKASEVAKAAIDPQKPARDPNMPFQAPGPVYVAPQVPVYVQSYAVRGQDAIVYLSDGRELTGASGLALITRDWVSTVDGVRYPIRHKPPVKAPAAAKPPGA